MDDETVKARPILFSGPMVRALLEGRKTQTRRIIKGPLTEYLSNAAGSARCLRGVVWNYSFEEKLGTCSYGEPGDLLWVREAHYLTDDGESEHAVFAADEEHVAYHKQRIAGLPLYFSDELRARHLRLHSSVRMPRWASRLTLEIMDVRVQRLQAISEEDAKAEGIEWRDPTAEDHEWSRENFGRDCPGCFIAPGTDRGFGPREFREQSGCTAAHAYAFLWEHINGRDSWGDNPWVWALAFKVHQQNIDAFLQAREAA